MSHFSELVKARDLKFTLLVRWFVYLIFWSEGKEDTNTIDTKEERPKRRIFQSTTQGCSQDSLAATACNAFCARQW